MHQKRNKKIFIYIFLFLVFGTLNNKNFDMFNFGKVNNISIKGLDEANNISILKKLNFIKEKNIFNISEISIKEIIGLNNLVEGYSVFKLYPSSLDIRINKIEFLAIFRKNEDNFFLGSNGKFIKTTKFKNDLPVIFGEFQVEKFFELKNAMDEINFDYNEVQNLFFFKSGRWDIETKNDLLIKLPEKNIKESLITLNNFLQTKKSSQISEVDLRQKNQIIIDG